MTLCGIMMSQVILTSVTNSMFPAESQVDLTSITNNVFLAESPQLQIVFLAKLALLSL